MNLILEVQKNFFRRFTSYVGKVVIAFYRQQNFSERVAFGLQGAGCTSKPGFCIMIKAFVAKSKLMHKNQDPSRQKPIIPFYARRSIIMKRKIIYVRRLINVFNGNGWQKVAKRAHFSNTLGLLCSSENLYGRFRAFHSLYHSIVRKIIGPWECSLIYID